MSINPEYASGFQGRGDIGGGTVKSYYDQFTGNNPNLQWISGASNQANASPEQKQKTQDYHQNWIGAVTPIPIVEGIALTAKGAKLPGLLPSTFKTIKAVPKRGTTLNKFGQIKTSFDDVLKDYGALAGVGDVAFRVLPLQMKIKIGLQAMARIFTEKSDQISTNCRIVFFKKYNGVLLLCGSPCNTFGRRSFDTYSDLFIPKKS